jgi:2-hydroxyglutarate dehydrogenase
MHCVDHIIIGAGAVGLSTAQRLIKRGSTLLVDSQLSFGMETSSRNSEVIHSGIYYPIDSLKTKLCIKGRELLYSYCKDRIPHQKITKWVVAPQDQEDRLDQIYEHAKQLGIPIYYQSKERGLKLEPLIKCNSSVVLPETGIFDSHQFMQSLLFDYEILGGDVSFKTKVMDISPDGDGYRVLLDARGESMTINTPNIINAAGLYSDVIASMVLCSTTVPKLYFAKGHYYATKKKIAKRLIYPIPCKNLTSLGLHLTIDLGGNSKFGPDVLFQDSRTDYGFEGDIQQAIQEISTFVAGIRKEDLSFGYTGIRPKLAPPGGAFQDFKIEHPLKGFINLMGIESPGLTSSLAIAETVEKMLY